MYTNSPEEQTSPREARNSPPTSQRTKPGSYGKACDTCRKKKARCNFERPTCGYCSAFKHQCTYTAAAACASRRNAKKLSIETRRQRPSLPARKSTGGSFKQPYSADAASPSGYLTPITPLDRRLHSTSAGGYHSSRVPDLLGSPIPATRSVYSPDSTSPSVPLSPINGHGSQRYQPQEVRPYGQATNGYIPTPRLGQKVDGTQRSDSYVAVPLMNHSGKEPTQGHNLIEPGSDSHPFPQSGIHHDEQIQRVVSPANQATIQHYQAQYAGYETYQRGEIDVSRHDPRQQVPPDWTVRRASVPLPTPEQGGMYRYHEVESHNSYIR